MYQYNDIRQIHLEVTQNCQASCPMCDRNQNGGALNPHINLDELNLKDCYKIFEPEFIQQLDTMYMCGNLGDPIIALDTIPIFDYFRDNNESMWLSMNTNGGARDVEWWKELARVLRKPAAVIFSVDGLRDTNHLYRQGVVWDNVEQNMRAFIEAGGRARWDYLIFEHNQHQLEEARALAEAWGVEKFVAKKTSRFTTTKVLPKENHQAVNRKGEKTQELKKPKEEYQNSAVKKLPDLMKKYGNLENYANQVPIQCRVQGDKSLFVSAEGLLLPCCWTAGRMYKWWLENPYTEPIWQYINRAGGKDSINAKKVGMKAVFETGIFDEIEKSFTRNRMNVCAMKCGTEFNPIESQYE